MNDLPLEILDIIACSGGYRGLLCLRKFTNSLTVSRRVDFMIKLGYSVKITRKHITWRYIANIHRVDGPAVETNDGSKEWFVNGKRHRIDGPALDYISMYKEWWVDGIRQQNN